MIAYVDESGDTGTRGRGSRWFVLGCAVALDADAAAAREALVEGAAIAGQPEPSRLHFTSLSHDNKMGVIQLLADAPWTGIVVASDTTKIHPRSPLANPAHHYNYVARYVVERISRLAEEADEPASALFEHRKGVNFPQFRDYIGFLSERGERRVNPSYLPVERMRQLSKGDDSLLCIADGLAYACFRALEPDRKWKRTERSYLDALRPRLWRGPISDPDVHKWGMTLMPTPMRDSFVEEHPWIATL